MAKSFPMRKILFISILFILGSTGYSQGFYYAGGGYNAAFLKSEGLDYVINRYNETRPYLDETMPSPHFYDGLTFHFGGAANAFFWDFGFTYRSCVVSATGVDASGTEQQRDVKNKWNTFDVGLGVNLGNSDTKALMIGINTGLNSEKSLTRADTPEDIGIANFAKVNSQFKIGFEPFVQFIVATENGLGILFKPYYSWSPIKTDYTELNAYINQYTYINDPSPIEGVLKGFGLSIMLVGYGEDN